MESVNTWQKLKFRKYWTRFDSKHLLFFILFFLRSPMTSAKNEQQMTPPPLPLSAKWTKDLLFKKNGIRKHVTNFKCMIPFWFFKVWFVICLNANEVLNFMKIQSSYLLLSYRRNQAYISYYIKYFLNNFLVSLCQ